MKSYIYILLAALLTSPSWSRADINSFNFKFSADEEALILKNTQTPMRKTYQLGDQDYHRTTFPVFRLMPEDTHVLDQIVLPDFGVYYEIAEKEGFIKVITLPSKKVWESTKRKHRYQDEHDTASAIYGKDLYMSFQLTYIRGDVLRDLMSGYELNLKSGKTKIFSNKEFRTELVEHLIQPSFEEGQNYFAEISPYQKTRYCRFSPLKEDKKVVDFRLLKPGNPTNEVIDASATQSDKYGFCFTPNYALLMNLESGQVEKSFLTTDPVGSGWIGRAYYGYPDMTNPAAAALFDQKGIPLYILTRFAGVREGGGIAAPKASGAILHDLKTGESILLDIPSGYENKMSIMAWPKANKFFVYANNQTGLIVDPVKAFKTISQGKFKNYAPLYEVHLQEKKFQEDAKRSIIETEEPADIQAYLKELETNEPIERAR